MTSNAKPCPGNASALALAMRRGLQALFCLAAIGLTHSASAQNLGNDRFVTASEIFGPRGTVTGANTGFSRETNEPIHSLSAPLSARSAWFKWQAPADGLVTFDTIGSSFDTILAVYRATGTNGVADLQQIISNDDVPGLLQSRVQFDAQASTNYYYIAVDGFGSGFATAAGLYVLNWAQGATNPPIAPGLVRFSATNYVGNEGFPATEITVWYGGFDPANPPAGDVTVDYHMRDGTALAGTNYVATNGTLTFGPDEYVKTFTVVHIGDTNVNNSRTVFLQLSNAVNAVLAPLYANAELLIMDDEAPLLGTPAGGFGFSSSLYVATERETTGRLWVNNQWTALGAMVTVTRGSTLGFTSNAASGRVLVDFETVFPQAATAFPGKPVLDYSPVSGTLFFDDYQMSASIVIPVGSDNVVNGNKAFDVVLKNPRPDPFEQLYGGVDSVVPYLNPLASRTTVNVIDLLVPSVSGNVTNTNRFSIERAYYRGRENGSAVNVDVILPFGGAGSVDVRVVGNNRRYSDLLLAGSDYAQHEDRIWPSAPFTDGTPPLLYPADFVVASTTLTFPQPPANGAFIQTATFTINNDVLAEFNEDFRIELANGSLPIGPNREATLTILFDDQPAGAADREWNPEAISATQPPYNPTPGANNTVQAIAVQPDTLTVLVGDFTAANAVSRNRVARMLPDGSLDLGFNPGSGANASVYAVALANTAGTSQANIGKILIGGQFTAYNGIQRRGLARLNVDGSLDTTFNVGTGADGPVHSIALQSDGKILVAGDFAHFNDVEVNGIMRLNEDGSVDDTFNPGVGANGSVWSVVVWNTQIYVAGEFTAFNGIPRIGVVRLRADGSVDPLFDPGVGADGPVYALAVQSNNRLLIGGGFSEYQNASRNNIARLMDNGDLDITYNVGVGTDDSIYTIVLQQDGKALIGGIFTTYNGARRVGIARLKLNGSLDTSFMDTAYNQFAGVIKTYQFEPSRSVNAIALQPDGNVMIGGSFSEVGGNFSSRRTPLTPTYLQGGWSLIEGGTWEAPFSRADKSTRYNIARLIGGYTYGPGNLEFDPTAMPFAIDENAPLFRATVRRIDGNLGTIGLSGSTIANSATVGVDFSNSLFGVSWPEGAYNAPLSIGDDGIDYFDTLIFDDTMREGDETFDLLASGLFGRITLGGEVIPLQTASGFHDRSTVSIADNDFDHGEFNFLFSNFATNENSVTATITVIRTNGASGSATVDYLVANGTAIAGQDYQAIVGPRTLSFIGGQTNRTFTIQLLNDATVELDETVLLILTNATGGATLPGGLPNSSATATLTIIDDDFAPGRLNFSAETYTADENSGFARVAVTRTGGSIAALSITVQTSDDTAVAPGDYAATTTNLTWASGDINPKYVNIPLVADGVVEGPETFNLRLLNASIGGAMGTRTNAVVTIADNDAYGAVSFSLASYLVNEAAGGATITVLRRGGTAGTVTVNFQAVADTAVDGVNFVATNGLLKFLPGETRKTFRVPILNDLTQDGDKTVRLLLSDAVSGSIGAPGEALLNIVDAQGVNAPAGSLDTLFSTDATVDGAVYSILLQTNGQFMIGGEFTRVKATPRNRLARINADGTLDNSFDVGPGANAPIRALAFQSDGRLLVGGGFTSLNSTNRNGIARLAVNGKVDISFDPGAGADNPVYSILVLPDDKVLVGGAFSTFDGRQSPGLVALQTNGAVYGQFNVGAGFNGSVFALALQDDGKILVGGDFKTYRGISRTNLVRLNMDGSLDETFNPAFTASSPIRALLVESDGKILVGGSFTNINGSPLRYLARVERNGSLDIGFLTFPGAGPNNTVFTLEQQVDGAILVGGEFTRFNGVTRNGITRLRDLDGATDPTINFGEGANGSVAAIAVQPDAKILIGGAFTEYDGQPRRGLARIYGGALSGLGSIEFSAPLVVVSETLPTAIITVSRRGGTTGAVSAQYDAYDGTALAGRDFVAASGVVQFPEGETRVLISVGIIPNNLADGDREFYVLLSNFVGAEQGVQPYTTVTIIDDESTIAFTTTDYSVNENAISGNATIGVTRTGGTNSTVSVNFSTVNGIALAGEDFVGTNGTLVFLPGQTFKNFNVRILDDGFSEGNETLGLRLTNPSASVALGLSQATLVIVDNDFGPGEFTFSAPDFFVDESAGVANIFVRRENGSSGLATVRLSTTTGTATAGSDYVPADRQLTFADGETIKSVTVGIQNDTIVEGNEFVGLLLSDATGGAGLGGLTNSRLTIVDDESGVRLESATYAVAEDDGVIRITVERTGNTNVDASVAFSTTPGTAIGGVDYVSTNGVLLFSPGIVRRWFDVYIIPDALTETNETFTVQLGNPSPNVQIGTPGSATVNIGDSARFVSFVSAAYQVSEGATNVAIGIRRTGLHTRSISVYLRTREETAYETVDFVPYTDIIKFNEGESNKTVLIPIIDDGLSELPEKFYVDLILPDRAAVTSPGTTAITIIDNDLGPGMVDVGFNVGVGANKFVRSVELQPDGRVLVGGAFTNFGVLVDGGSTNFTDITNRNYLVRVHTNGVYDSSFNLGSGPNAIVSAIKWSPDGGIVVGGAFTSMNGTPMNRLARLTALGALDPVFTVTSRFDSAISALDVQADNRIIAGGSFSVPTRGVARIRINASADLTFDVSSGADAIVHSVVSLPNGGVLAGGAFTNFGGFNSPRLVRLGASGLVDVTMTPLVVTNGVIYSVTLAPDGKIIIGGSFRHINGIPRSGVARLNWDGTLDLTFDPGLGANGVVYTTAVLADGRVFIGGDFTLVNGEGRGRYALLGADGQLDYEFDSTVGADNTVYASVVQPDQKIIIGGDFTTVTGITNRGVARINVGELLPLRLGVPRIVMGHFTVMASTIAGNRYVLETSTNMEYEWTPLSTNTATGGSLLFTDPNAPTAETRFYRVRRYDP